VGRRLTIRGEKKQEQKEKEETYYRVERSYGYFKRTIELPAEVDPNKVDASYKRGVLKLKLRKVKESEAKRIKVTPG
jgi:HSP20 family protein